MYLCSTSSDWMSKGRGRRRIVPPMAESLEEAWADVG
jgi:hypothetical protein